MIAGAEMLLLVVGRFSSELRSGLELDQTRH
jgi:hypothetical protein